jgi:hypothetical protein
VIPVAGRSFGGRADTTGQGPIHRPPDDRHLNGHVMAPFSRRGGVHYQSRFLCLLTPRSFVRLTDLLISCARPRAPRSDAARPLPRLTMHLEEAICNGRDAVASKVTEELQLRSI